MNYSKYEVFLKVVEFGSMSQAATYCNYSQSAVSQIVSSLEQELKVTVLKRSQTGIQLTSDGNHLLPYIQELSRAEERVYVESDKLRGVETGNIRLGTFSSVACYILVPILTKFKKAYPNINIEVREGDNLQIESWLSEGSVDLGFIDAPAPTGFDTIDIYTDPFVAVMSNDREFTKLKKVPLKTFEETPMVLFNEGTKKEAAGLLHKQKIKPKVEYVSRDDSMILSLIENDLCIGYMGRLIINRTRYNVTYRYTDPQFERKIVLALRDMEKANSATKKLIDFISEHLKSALDELEV